MNWFTEYKNTLKMTEIEEVIDLIFYRPIAFLFVKSIYHTRITPNHLTIAAIIMGLTGACCFASGLNSGCILGALFCLLFNILDCSDGQLARLKRNGTPVGRLLDGIADYISTIAIFIGIAIGYTQKAEQPTLMLILLSLSGVSVIIQGFLVDYYRTRFLDNILKRKNTFEEGIEEYKNEYEKIKNQKARWFDKSVILIYLAYSELQRKVVARKKEEKPFNTTPQEYYDKNRVIIRFWVFIGPSANMTILIICALFGRFDIFFWIIIGGFNILAALLGIIQQRIDKSFVTL